MKIHLKTIIMKTYEEKKLELVKNTSSKLKNCQEDSRKEKLVLQRHDAKKLTLVQKFFLK